MKHGIAFSLALALSSVAAQADQSTGLRAAVVATGPGGSVVDYARQVSSARIGGQGVTFKGLCASACTLYLSLPASDMCIMPGASFTFHRPYGAGNELNSWAASYMYEQYPAWVRNWISAQGGLTDRLLRMDYSYAAQFVPTCQVDTGT